MVTKEIAASIYVDDLLSGRYEKGEVKQLKELATKILQEVGFTLHKWHANCSIESHVNLHETTKHQLTNKVTTTSQESQAQKSGEKLATSENTEPKHIPGIYNISKATTGFKLNRYQDFRFPLE